jgi:hypothetical protein
MAIISKMPLRPQHAAIYCLLATTYEQVTMKMLSATDSNLPPTLLHGHIYKYSAPNTPLCPSPLTVGRTMSIHS